MQTRSETPLQLAVMTACNHFLVHAKMAMLEKNFGRAEAILALPPRFFSSVPSP